MTLHPHPLRRCAATLVLAVALASVAATPATAAVATDTLASTSTKTGGDAITNVTTPYFVGTPKVGYTLTARPGRWNPSTATLTYAWFDGSRLLATGAAYVVRPAELGHTITITATAASPGRAPAARSWTSPTGVVRGTFWIRSAPRVHGRATVGRRLTARSSATEPNGRRTYRWLRDGRAIGGATGSTYRVKKIDRRHRLAVRVSYTAPAYDAASRTSRRTHRVR